MHGAMLTVLSGVGLWTAWTAMKLAEAVSNVATSAVDACKCFTFARGDQWGALAPRMTAAVVGALGVLIWAMCMGA